MREMKDTLENLLNAPRKVSFEGVVSAGLGEGAYYVKEYEGRIFKRLGFKPYPGTLNVRLGRSPQDLLRYTTVEVLGFEKDGRRYGVIRFAKAKIAYGRKEVECFFVLPERTHHREEAEFISKENLRSLLGISDGSKVRVSFVVK